MKTSKTTKPVKGQIKKSTAQPKKPTTAKRAGTTSIKAKATPSTVPPRPAITTEIIATHAYILWEKDGRPPGRDVEYWLRAESELKQDTQSFAA